MSLAPADLPKESGRFDLPIALGILAAHRDGRAFVLPESSAQEAALVPGAVVHPAASLLQVRAHLAGQAQARRALEIAAAGGHSLLIL